MNLYEIRDKARKSGRAVFSIQQLANLMSSTKLTAAVYASRLVAKKLAERLIRGKIKFSDDERVIATQLIEPSYISLYNALLIHGIIQQVPANIACVTPKTSRKFSKHGIHYHRIPTSLFFGFERIKSDNDYYFLASPEKALIDGIYLHGYPKNLIGEIMKKIDKKKLKKLLQKVPKKIRTKIEGELYD